MSSSSAPPPTRTSTAPASTSSTVEIPSTTVISIGLGFVAFTVGLMFILVTSRLMRVYRRMRLDQSRGRPLTFIEAWNSEGGIFGFLTGLGSAVNNTGGVYGRGSLGGGYLGEHELIRRRDELLALLSGQVQVEQPKMWEVPVEEKGYVKVDEGDFDPISLTSSIPPKFIDRAKDPNELPKPALTISLLIAFPSEPPSPKSPKSNTHRLSVYSASSGAVPNAENEKEEEYPDLPEVAIGVTEIKPMISGPPPVDDRRGSSMDQARRLSMQRQISGKSIMSTEKAGKGEKEGMFDEIEELEYANTGERRARWVRAEAGRWKIEGLG